MDEQHNAAPAPPPAAGRDEAFAVLWAGFVTAHPAGWSTAVYGELAARAALEYAAGVVESVCREHAAAYRVSSERLYRDGSGNAAYVDSVSAAVCEDVGTAVRELLGLPK